MGEVHWLYTQLQWDPGRRNKLAFVLQRIVDVSCVVVGLLQRASYRWARLTQAPEAPTAYGPSRFLIRSEISGGYLSEKSAPIKTYLWWVWSLDVNASKMDS